MNHNPSYHELRADRKRRRRKVILAGIVRDVIMLAIIVSIGFAFLRACYVPVEGPDTLRYYSESEVSKRLSGESK